MVWPFFVFWPPVLLSILCLSRLNVYRFCCFFLQVRTLCRTITITQAYMFIKNCISIFYVLYFTNICCKFQKSILCKKYQRKTDWFCHSTTFLMTMIPDRLIFKPGSENKALKKCRILWHAFFLGVVYVISYFFFMWQAGVTGSLSLLVFALTFHFVITFIVSALVLYFLIGVLRKIWEFEEPESNKQIEVLVFTGKADIGSRPKRTERFADNSFEPFRTEDAFVMQVKNILENNIDNHTFKINDLCSELAVSRAQLYRKFKSSGNIGIYKHLKILRLNKALGLLSSSDLNVTQVAFSAGFKNLSHFDREFFLRFGETPRKIQKAGCKNPG
jgi:AraC-like DNA-binding protein